MMAVSSEYADYLRDLLQPLGQIRLRRMFGGYGIYAGDLFFALVLEEQLYFKVDKITRPQFEAAQLEEWIYEKAGKPVHMNYFRPPDDIHDEEDSLRLWGRLALGAALRARKPSKSKPAVVGAAGKPARISSEEKALDKIRPMQEKITPAHKSGQKKIR